MDHSCLLSGIGIVGETVNHSKWNDAEPGAQGAGWLRCMETIFTPFWFWFAPVCEVPFTIVQIVIFTQIGVRDATERSILETLDTAAFRRYFLIRQPLQTFCVLSTGGKFSQRCLTTLKERSEI